MPAASLAFPGINVTLILDEIKVRVKRSTPPLRAIRQCSPGAVLDAFCVMPDHIHGLML